MTRKKLLSLLLTLALLASLLPAAALPALAEEESGPVSVSTWNDLVEAAATGGSIILAADVAAPETGEVEEITVPAGKTATIDLNGHVIDAKQQTENVITVKGTLTLKDSKPEASHEGTDLPAGGVITGSDDGVEVTKTGTFTMPLTVS